MEMTTREKQYHSSEEQAYFERMAREVLSLPTVTSAITEHTKIKKLLGKGCTVEVIAPVSTRYVLTTGDVGVIVGFAFDLVVCQFEGHRKWINEKDPSNPLQFRVGLTPKQASLAKLRPYNTRDDYEAPIRLTPERFAAEYEMTWEDCAGGV